MNPRGGAGGEEAGSPPERRLTDLCNFLMLFFGWKLKGNKNTFLGVLGPTWSVSEANLAPKTEPKSRFLDVQEGTYLKIAENVKI